LQFLKLSTFEERRNISDTLNNIQNNINAVNQWIARYKKDGIKGLNEKPHTGRIGAYLSLSDDEFLD
jgi:transposase